MPVLDDITSQLQSAKVFSTFDAKTGYWQIPLTERSSELTTFNTPFGRYRWNRLPFGLNVAGEEFQKRMIDALEGLENVFVIVDDILVIGRGETQEEAVKNHDRAIIQLFKRLKEKSIKINQEKVQFKKTEVKYMGHILSDTGLKIDEQKVSAIQKM